MYHDADPYLKPRFFLYSAFGLDLNTSSTTGLHTTAVGCVAMMMLTVKCKQKAPKFKTQH